MKALILILLFPVALTAQKGFTFVNESGTIKVTKKDTIVTEAGTQYSTDTRSFADSAAAGIYLETIKNQYFVTAAQYAALAHADSVSANRLRTIGDDAGLFSIPEKVTPPEKIPELIIVPEQPKKKATKPKTKKKKT